MDRRRERTPKIRVLATVFSVFVGCYLGASLGTWVRFPEIGSALIFAPYAIVTAALWRSEPRFWWMFLLAASAGNFMPHHLGGDTVAFVLTAELVNHLRSVIAAIGLRRLAGRTTSLREMAWYLTIAVAAAPGLAGLAGAILVTSAGKSLAFKLAWQQWWLSNSITALTLLPVLTIDLRRLATTEWRRLAELALFAVALIATSAGMQTFVSPVHMYWALPFLLFAAARFGARATSGALLALTTLSILSAMTHSPSSADLLELQVFLIAVSIPLLLLAVLLDQQRKTAAELMESRRQYRSVVEDQTEMICRFRPDGRYTFANRAYCEAFAVLEPVGRTIWDVVPAGIHPTASQLDLLTPGAPIASREVNVAVADGAARWHYWQERGLFDEQGVVVEYQAVGRDITDRKRAEEEHRELEAQRSVEAVLREADRRKDEFLATLGHELRNPLAPIGIGVELLIAEPPGSSRAQWARESIGRQLRKMTRLIDDLLDLSRVTLGRIQLQLESVNLGTLIANAVEELRPFIDSFGHTLIVQLPDEPVRLRADGVRLAQVVTNLLHNAAKYTEPGGRIEVRVEKSGTSIRLSVRDNGIGLDPEALESIFELFAQLPAARERAQGGLGIGLTLVKRLVELHGGTVMARSEGRNRGTEMIVELPATPDEGTEPKLPIPRAGTLGPSLRVLAVDDNVDLATGLAAVLGLWGHSVRTAHDGVSAIEVATAFAPEVVLLDLGLPMLDGFEVARRLQRLRRRSGLTPPLFVSMSGFGPDYVRGRAGEVEFAHHAVKPIDLEWLRGLLVRWARQAAGSATTA